MSTTSSSISPDWPALPFPEWEATCDTVHLWTQIVGKTRLTLSPPQNHWWQVPLYVTPRGLNTSPIPFGKATFDVEFDFIAHQLEIRTNSGEGRGIPLFPVPWRIFTPRTWLLCESRNRSGHSSAVVRRLASA